MKGGCYAEHLTKANGGGSETAPGAKEINRPITPAPYDVDRGGGVGRGSGVGTGIGR